LRENRKRNYLYFKKRGLKGNFSGPRTEMPWYFDWGAQVGSDLVHTRGVLKIQVEKGRRKVNRTGGRGGSTTKRYGNLEKGNVLKRSDRSGGRISLWRRKT